MVPSTTAILGVGAASFFCHHPPKASVACAPQWARLYSESNKLNAVEIEEAITQLADQPFDAEDFPYAFLEAFGNKETTIKNGHNK